jgi:hypothetical protein
MVSVTDTLIRKIFLIWNISKFDLCTKEHRHGSLCSGEVLFGSELNYVIFELMLWENIQMLPIKVL